MVLPLCEKYQVVERLSPWKYLIKNLSWRHNSYYVVDEFVLLTNRRITRSVFPVRFSSQR